WSEIKFFVIQWIVRDVHLAIKPTQRAIRIENRGSIVIHAGRALLKQRRNQNNVKLLRQVRYLRGRWPRNRFGKIEQRYVLALAEILGLKKLGEANDLCASTRRFTNLLDSVLEIFLRIRRG